MNTLKNILILPTLLLSLLTATTSAQTDAHPHHAHHDNHAHHGHHTDRNPISIMGTHSHQPGEWMSSYKFMFMDMDGLRAGDNGISTADAFAENYTVAPIEMPMQMHMFGLMYSPIQRVTIGVMGHYRSAEMEHRIFPNAAPLLDLNDGNDTFTTESSGFGDTLIGARYDIRNEHTRYLNAGLHLSLPTGSTTEEDIIPGPGGRIKRRLPAAMQPGSGSFALIPSLTGVFNQGPYTFGAQGKAVLHTGDNDEGYQRGDRFHLTTWGGYGITDALGLNLGLAFTHEEELDGTQEDIATNPPFAPARRTVSTAFGENYGGDILDALLGVTLNAPTDGPLTGNRLGLDLRVPLIRDLNGIQLETDWTLTAAWQVLF